MNSKIVRRSADITPQEALAGLTAKYPNAKVASFDISPNGKQYIAKLVLGEFPPPAKDEGGGDEESSEEEGPPAPEAASDDEGGEGPPKEKKEKKGNPVEEKLLHLVEQIALAVGVAPTPDDAPLPGDDMAGADMPPPPVADHSGAPPPLPPPAKPHGMGGGGGLGSPFAKVASERRSFIVWREPDPDGSLPSMKQAVSEIAAVLPSTHRVAKIVKRHGKIDQGRPTFVYVAAVSRR